MIIPAEVGPYDLIHNKILLQLYYEFKIMDYNGLLFLVYCYLLYWIKNK
jgi:hypothetical protein